MKILRKILIVLAIIVAIPLIAALFIKKEYAVERSITINKPKQVVFDYIKLIKNQDNYSKWNMTDPLMKKAYRGTDGTVGFVASWESQNDHVGIGEQELVKIVEGERIEIRLHFKVPFDAHDDAYMTTSAIDSVTTKVAWGFKGAFPYPMNILSLFFSMDKEVGGDLETGLTNLKTLLEK